MTEGRAFGDCFVVRTPGGAGPPVLLVPGAYHGWWAWRFWLEGFAATGRAAAALSFPNHTDATGLPEAAFCALRLEDYVARVEEVLALLEVESGQPAVLVGHSLGGVVAQYVASVRPLTGLVLVASAGPAALGVTRPTLYPTERALICPPERARQLFFHDAEPAVLDWALPLLCPESPGVMNGSGGRAEIPRDAIRCPVLVLAGAEDRAPIVDQALLARHYAAPLLLLPGLGHNLMLERRRDLGLGGVLGWLSAKLS